MNTMRPKEVEEFVSAMDNLWHRLGADKNCAECFRVGTFPCCFRMSHPVKVPCANLTPTGCVRKPMLCAIYTCGAEQGRGHLAGLSRKDYFRVRLLLHDLEALVNAGLFGGWDTGYEAECKCKFEPWHLERIRQATEKVRAFDVHN